MNNMSTGCRVLFVTWDGPNSSYLRGLFLPIFSALRDRGFVFHVLQFTWANSVERNELERHCAAAGVRYRSVNVWRRPVAVGALATAIWGRTHVRRAIDDFGIELLMPRSILPAAAALYVSRLPLMFDADGLPNEERREFRGGSSRPFSYQVLRAIETLSVRRAQAITVRTRSAAKILSQRAGVPLERFHVVPNARDAARFRPVSSKTVERRRRELGVGGPIVVYAGSSLTGKYLGEAMLRFFRHVLALQPDARLLLLMPTLEEARALLSANEDIASACIVRSVVPEDVPGWLAAADLGLCMIRPSYSMQAASAIKLGEYLLCGLPVVATGGVGENESIIGKDVGVCLSDTGDKALAAASDWFVRNVLPNRRRFRDACREAGVTHFSLQIAVSSLGDALAAARRRTEFGEELS